jgi:rhamnogalacturonan endolyase
MVFGCFELALGLLALAAGAQAEPARRAAKPFMIKDGTSYIIGNDVWNLTIDARGFGKKLMYRDTDLVGRASGHYVSYSMSSSVWEVLTEQMVRRQT